MFYSKENILKAEHDALMELLPAESNPAYAAGVTNGILHVVEKLLKGDENGRTDSD
jgi:hypothetical protein